MADGGDVLVWGVHAVRAVLARRPRDVLEVLALPDVAARLGYSEGAPAGMSAPLTHVDRAQLDRRAGGAAHQGVIARVRPARALGEPDLDALLAQHGEPLVLVLDGVQDPGNLGACLRTADAAGVHAVVVPQRRAVGLTPAVRKTACGAAEHVPLVVVANLARVLRTLGDAGVTRVAADAGAPLALAQADLRGPLAWVLGGEGQGLRALTRSLCDVAVTIPLHGVAGSLNVSVATGICLYETRRQRGF